MLFTRISTRPNIAWKLNSDDFAIVDVGTSIMLSRENPVPRCAGDVEGVFARVVPEKTGGRNGPDARK